MEFASGSVVSFEKNKWWTQPHATNWVRWIEGENNCFVIKWSFWRCQCKVVLIVLKVKYWLMHTLNSTCWDLWHHCCVSRLYQRAAIFQPPYKFILHALNRYWHLLPTQCASNYRISQICKGAQTIVKFDTLKQTMQYEVLAPDVPSHAPQIWRSLFNNSDLDGLDLFTCNSHKLI
jgi:hypothetical protein